MCKEALSLTWGKAKCQGKERFMACLGWSLAQEPFAKGGEAKEKRTDEKCKGRCWLL